MNEYSCWFCAGNIDRVDTGAVMIVVESLWDWDDGNRSDAWQSVYAHSHCAKARLTGATMSIEPHIFGEAFETPENPPSEPEA